MKESPTKYYLCFMRTFGITCFLLLLSFNANAQVVFKMNQKQSLPLTVNDSAVLMDTASLTHHRLQCISGNIVNSRFESQIGGNDSSMQAVLLIFDSLLYNSVHDNQVIPVGMAKKGIYWGLSFVDINVPFLDVPFVVCVLPKDTNQFESFAQNYLSAPDFQWVDVPQKKDSSKSIFKTLNIDEYLLPLPCSHDDLYVEYLNDSTLNLVLNVTEHSQIQPDSCVELVEQHLKHLRSFHGDYCGCKARLFFANRNVNMNRVTWFFERFSDLNVQLDILFSENTEK